MEDFFILKSFVLVLSISRTLFWNLKKILYVFFKKTVNPLKVQSCRLYNNKYMIASTQTTNTESFASLAVLIFKLLSRKDLFINRKDNRNC